MVLDFAIHLFLTAAGAIQADAAPPPTPSGWVRHAAPGVPVDGFSYTLALPSDFRGGQVQGIDSFVSRYSGPDLNLDLDFGHYGNSSCPAECSRIQVDGVSANRSVLPPGGRTQGGWVVFYYVPMTTAEARWRVGLAIGAACQTEQACALADEIVRRLDILPPRS